MAYLILPDFKKLIQTDNLNQIIGNDYTLLSDVSDAAVKEAKSYLTQKYDCARELSDTLLWNRTTAYEALQRVYLDADAYNAASTYALNSLVTYSGNVYICTTAVTVAEAFNSGKWGKLGAQYDKFYITLPQPEFQLNGIYKRGDLVWWKNKIYTCQISTVLLSHGQQLQYGDYASVPPQNIFPDDTVKGALNWGNGTAYSVTAGTLPTDTTKWTAADNRNNQLVNYCIDIALYTLHSRIAPRNIPELRVKRYDDAIRWLKDAARGEYITADLPAIQPTQGNRIRFGSEIKKNNQY